MTDFETQILVNCMETLHQIEARLSAPKKWEYKTVDRIMDSDAQKLGAEGWELVAVRTFLENNDGRYIFKREVRG